MEKSDDEEEEGKKKAHDVNVVSVDGQNPLVSTDGSLPLNGVFLQTRREEGENGVRKS